MPRLLSLAATVALLAGCVPDFDFDLDFNAASLGQRGAVHFVWSGGDTLDFELFGSNAVAVKALAAGGASGTIALTDASDLPLAGVSVASSDESVVRVSISGSTITATSGTAGSAEVIVLASDGSELDRVALTVAEVTGIEAPAWGDPGKVLVLSGGLKTLHFRLIGGTQAIEGHGLATFRTEGGIRRQLVDPRQQFAEAIAFTVGPQPGSIVSTVGSHEARVDIVPVDRAALTVLRAPVRVDLKAGESEIVSVEAFAGSELVWGVRCAWSGGEGIVNVSEAVVPFLANAPREPYLFDAVASGTANVTCTVPGGLSTVVRVVVGG